MSKEQIMLIVVYKDSKDKKVAHAAVVVIAALDQS